MEFPITFKNFCRRLTEKYESSLRDYRQRNGGTVFRMILEEYRMLYQFFSIGEDFEEGYQKAIGGRKFLTVTNIPKEDSKEIIRFSDGKEVLAPIKVVKNLGALHRDVWAKYRCDQTLEKHPQIKEDLRAFEELKDQAKKEFFKDLSNWGLIKELMFYHRHKNPVFYYPVSSFLKFFPFSDQTDAAFDFFKELYEYMPRNCYGLDKLFVESYGTRYFDYLFYGGIERNRDSMKRYLLDRGLYRFPFDLKNFKHLEKLCDKKFYTCALNSIGYNRPETVSDSDYKQMVDIICQNVGLPISPTDEQVIEFCEKKDHIKYGNYTYYWNMLYEAGYYRPSKDEIKDKISRWAKESDEPIRKYKLPLQTMIDSHYNPSLRNQLMEEYTDDSKVLQWLRKLFN